MKTIKNLIIKYRELIVYVFFGVSTTLVNLVTFYLSNLILGEERYLFSNIIAWIISVIFAYLTNKMWVFESKSWERQVLLKEVPSFFSARVFSFLVEELGLYLLVDVLHFDSFDIEVLSYNINGEMIAKIILAVIVVILNYVFSKLLVFKKKK